MMYKELDADDDEMTRTRKLRRGFVAERYANLIEALYGDREELAMESEIRYQDGTGFTMKTQVRIREVRESS
jgi:long-chain acyl-CoA synthetase